jgi:hypothetical protein
LVGKGQFIAAHDRHHLSLMICGSDCQGRSDGYRRPA